MQGVVPMSKRKQSEALSCAYVAIIMAQIDMAWRDSRVDELDFIDAVDDLRTRLRHIETAAYVATKEGKGRCDD
jgi:hypothetical protein